ncbi:MAG: hypothetical protein ACLUNV_10935 [Sutterella wadsworthensis]
MKTNEDAFENDDDIDEMEEDSSIDDEAAELGQVGGRRFRGTGFGFWQPPFGDGGQWLRRSGASRPLPRLGDG